MSRVDTATIALGIVGALVGVIVDRGFSPELRGMALLVCILGGCIVGAIIGGTQDIVAAVKRGTRPSNPEDTLDP